MIIWMIVLSILFVSLKTQTSFSPMIDLERYINGLLIPELWQVFDLVFYFYNFLQHLVHILHQMCMHYPHNKVYIVF